MVEEDKGVDTLKESEDNPPVTPEQPAGVEEPLPAAESRTMVHEVHREAAPEVPPKTLERRRPLSRRTRNALLAVGAILVIVLAAYLSLGVTFTDSPGSASYPYTVTYEVIFPNSEIVRVGNVEILAIPSADKVALSINKQADEILLDQAKEISVRRATISMLGVPILEFDFKMVAEYKGMVGKDAKFNLAVKTSDQLPAFIVDRLLPASIQAKPA